jgi:hypothetical protein
MLLWTLIGVLAWTGYMTVLLYIFDLYPLTHSLTHSLIECLCHRDDLPVVCDMQQWGQRLQHIPYKVNYVNDGYTSLTHSLTHSHTHTHSLTHTLRYLELVVLEVHHIAVVHDVALALLR